MRHRWHSRQLRLGAGRMKPKLRHTEDKHLPASRRKSSLKLSARAENSEQITTAKQRFNGNNLAEIPQRI
jgi:hypothetical protein